MDSLDDSDSAEPPIPILAAISIPAAAIALVTCNAVLYLHSRSVEYHVRRNWTGVRPWLWPEDVLGTFLLTWVVAIIVSRFAMYRLRSQKLKHQCGIVAATAFVSILINAFLLIGESLNF